MKKSKCSFLGCLFSTKKVSTVIYTEGGEALSRWHNDKTSYIILHTHRGIPSCTRSVWTQDLIALAKIEITENFSPKCARYTSFESLS